MTEKQTITLDQNVRKKKAIPRGHADYLWADYFWADYYCAD